MPRASEDPADKSNEAKHAASALADPRGPSVPSEKRAGGKEEKTDAPAPAAAATPTLDEEESKMTVPDLMEQEFSRIIGHENIKTQLRQFYKKVQLDEIRQSAGKAKKDRTPLYHMIFSGPPGTGKTTMANVVAKVMLKMKLLESDKVVFVNNALDLLAHYAGQTPAKVDKKVEEAKGGVLFIDEAYSIVKGEAHQKDSFGKEAIETVMKHLDPPACVFIFAGYEEPMEDFLKVNEGLARRIPYRYVFKPYNPDELLKIFLVMCESKGEQLEEGLPDKVCDLLLQLDEKQRHSQNAGIIANWVSFAQIERDDRLTIEEALANPALASILGFVDLEKGLTKIKNMAGP